jgi:hypothetical protein
MYHLMCKKRSQPRNRASMSPLRMGFWVFLGLLLGSLFGCSSTKLVRELPPQDLLANCPVVVEEVSTNGGLVKTILAYRSSLSTCNIDKESLREWAESK